MNAKKKYIVFIFGMLFLSILLIGGTFAYLTLSASVTNGEYSGVTDCIFLDYDVTNDDGTLPISGTLFQSSTPRGGLSGKVTVSLSDECTFSDVIGNIKLNVDSTTSSLLLSEGALKYAVYDTVSYEPISTGVIDTTGDITLYQGFTVTYQPVSYYIYVWLDGSIANNNYINLSFNGAAYVEAIENKNIVKKYTINYNNNGGSGNLSSTSCESSDTCTTSNNSFIRTGYTFSGWNTKSDGSGISYAENHAFDSEEVYEGLVLYAQWTKNDTYKISYNANGGDNAPETQMKTRDGTLILSGDVPTREGFIFLGWGTSSASTTATYQPGGNYTENESVTLYAVWIDINSSTYTVSYDANGGDYPPSSQTKMHDVSLTLSNDLPTRTGYDFLGWSTSSTDTIVSYQPGGSYIENKSVTLYAVWKIQTYTISYDANGGDYPPSSQTKTYDVTLTLSNDLPTRTGYDFLGWSTSSTDNVATYQPGGSYTENESVTLYAVWRIKTYTISYNANGGSGAPASQTKTYGVTLKLSEVIPVREGYTFLGWATYSSATSATYQPGGNYTSNVSRILYAVWEIIDSDVDGPLLDFGLIPVKIANNGTVTTVLSTDETWYNYENKQWANAVLVTSSSRSTYLNTTGVTVNQADILGYYVWIPRFKYKIWTVSSGSSPQTIDIVLETSTSSKSSGTDVGEYLTHPAFTFGTKELSGFWVGKFETTGTDATPTVLPNLSSLNNQNVSAQFTTALKFAGGTLNTSTGDVTFSGNDTYGLTSSMDSHMMKNSEWGAVVYLSHSNFGKNAEIRLNNYYNIENLTGCGGIVDTIGQSSTCTLTYGKITNYQQTTTGNVSGVFDLAGGLYEHLMGIYNTSIGSSGFTTLPLDKYYDKYISTDTLTACNGGLCLGHALFETAGWYSDRVSVVNSSYPFISRGESYIGGAATGAFAYAGFNGSGNINISWRSVLSSQLSISSGESSDGDSTSGGESYTVTYDANGGSYPPSSQTKTHDVSLTLSGDVPTRTGYDFLGWSTSSTDTTATYQPGGNYTENESVTLYAVWQIKTFKISYDANGGSGGPTEQIKTYGVTLKLSNDVPVRDGYVFKGWGTYSSATSPTYQPGGSYTSNVSRVLYAVWEENVATTYTISYDANGGSGAPLSQTKTHDLVLTLSSTVPTKNGYKFAGWSTSSTAYTATYQSGASYTVNASTTLYAVWRNTFVGDPVLDSGMIPVTISDYGMVKTVSPADSTWYNYTNKKWANAVLVSSSSRSSYLNTTGKTVNQSDILAYFVWIPRYKYKIWTTSIGSSPQTIDIVFESSTTSKSNGTAVGQYLTHPAFTFGTKELSGFWVGKFETAGNVISPKILPNISSYDMKNNAVSTYFDASLIFSGGTLNKSTGAVTFAGNDTYGLTSSIDSHMMKNSEWGAVAYLSHSLYGINDEIRVNNYYNNGTLTGCGASSVVNSSQSTTCSIPYGGVIGSYPQSTTGNISGIFDMSGALKEGLMGNFGNVIGYGGFAKLPSDKYYDKYISTDTLTACNGGLCFGHALFETYDWYSDYTNFVDSTYMWINRGGAYNDTYSTNIGIFASNASNGGGNTFRVVLSS